jgi:hypothetical protein
MLTVDASQRISVSSLDSSHNMLDLRNCAYRFPTFLFILGSNKTPQGSCMSLRLLSRSWRGLSHQPHTSIQTYLSIFVSFGDAMPTPAQSRPSCSVLQDLAH